MKQACFIVGAFLDWFFVYLPSTKYLTIHPNLRNIELLLKWNVLYNLYFDEIEEEEMFNEIVSISCDDSEHNIYTLALHLSMVKRSVSG